MLNVLVMKDPPVDAQLTNHPEPDLSLKCRHTRDDKIQRFGTWCSQSEINI